VSDYCSFTGQFLSLLSPVNGAGVGQVLGAEPDRGTGGDEQQGGGDADDEPFASPSAVPGCLGMWGVNLGWVTDGGCP